MELQVFKIQTMNEITQCAGLLVYRVHNNKIQFLLVHPTNHTKKVYAIPKGHIELGETKILSAMRETYEETGVRAKPVIQLPEIRYAVYRDKSIKVVTFFLAEYESGVDENGVSHNHDFESDDVRFFDTNSLPAVYNTQQPVIDSALKYINNKILNK